MKNIHWTLCVNHGTQLSTVLPENEMIKRMITSFDVDMTEVFSQMVIGGASAHLLVGGTSQVDFGVMAYVPEKRCVIQCFFRCVSDDEAKRIMSSPPLPIRTT